jgi:hypothetical protein
MHRRAERASGLRAGGVRRIVLAVIVLSMLVFPAGPAAAAPASQAGCTYGAAFVSDVTVPDNSVVTAGATFTKTWRLRNTGSCAWGPGQPVDALSLVGGHDLGSSRVVPLTLTIWPGQAGEVSVRLVAPALAGTYRSEWMLRRANGTVFGLGAAGTRAFYVQFVVQGSGQQPPPQGERIQFAAGSAVGSVQGRVAFGAAKTYLLRARAGQEMTISIVSPYNVANYSIQGATDLVPYKRFEFEDRHFSFVLSMTQDYLVTVAVPAGTHSYILSVAISP